MSVKGLPTLAEVQALRHGAPIVKPATRLDRVKAKITENLKREMAFRRAVWARDESRCRVCHRRVERRLDFKPNRGEVHHLKPRSTAPAQRFDPKNGVLLCAECHPKVQRREVKVPICRV